MSDDSIIRALDRVKAEAAGMKLCEKCGWYANKYTHTHCSPAAGRVADALAMEALDANPTKLGYGEGSISFEISENVHVQFEIRRFADPPTIALSNVHALLDLGIVQAATLVRMITIVLHGPSQARNESPYANSLAALLIAWWTGQSARGEFEQGVIALADKIRSESHPMPCPQNAEYGHPCTCARRR